MLVHRDRQLLEQQESIAKLRSIDPDLVDALLEPDAYIGDKQRINKHYLIRKLKANWPQVNKRLQALKDSDESS